MDSVSKRRSSGCIPLIHKTRISRLRWHWILYDPLPSLNLVVKLSAKMNLRAAASMTVARPEFQELAPFQFTDFFGGELVQGNPSLQRT